MFGPVSSGHFGSGKCCPDYLGVLILVVEAVLFPSIVPCLVPVACVHIRRVSPLQGSG